MALRIEDIFKPDMRRKINYQAHYGDLKIPSRIQDWEIAFEERYEFHLPYRSRPTLNQIEGVRDSKPIDRYYFGIYRDGDSG